jgi:hypothetical protein
MSMPKTQLQRRRVSDARMRSTWSSTGTDWGRKQTTGPSWPATGAVLASLITTSLCSVSPAIGTLLVRQKVMRMGTMSMRVVSTDVRGKRRITKAPSSTRPFPPPIASSWFVRRPHVRTTECTLNIQHSLCLISETLGLEVQSNTTFQECGRVQLNINVTSSVISHTRHIYTAGFFFSGAWGRGVPTADRHRATTMWAREQ